MKAIVYHNYGPPDVLKYEEIVAPTAGDDAVLIRVRAASVNPLDWHFMRGTPYFLRIMTGLLNPKDPRLGVDVAGQVEAVGRNVTQFKPGDDVFGSCRGAFAEYACTAESALVTKPDSVTFEQAAAVPVAAYTALQGLHKHLTQWRSVGWADWSAAKPRSERAKKMDAKAGWSKAARKPWPRDAMRAGQGLDAAKTESVGRGYLRPLRRLRHWAR